MIVNIRDSSILKTIEPNILESYLKKKGWQEKAKIYDNIAAIWRFKKEASNEYEILVPLIQNQNASAGTFGIYFVYIFNDYVWFLV